MGCGRIFVWPFATCRQDRKVDEATPEADLVDQSTSGY
jgi:hypothetical protein